MDRILDYPVQAYDWVYNSYGFVGITVSALLIVFACFGAWFWFDRRK